MPAVPTTHAVDRARARAQGKDSVPVSIGEVIGVGVVASNAARTTGHGSIRTTAADADAVAATSAATTAAASSTSGATTALVAAGPSDHAGAAAAAADHSGVGSATSVIDAADGIHARAVPTVPDVPDRTAQRGAKRTETATPATRAVIAIAVKASTKKKGTWIGRSMMESGLMVTSQRDRQQRRKLQNNPLKSDMDNYLYNLPICLKSVLGISV